ncbi:hypothetical protein LNO36_16740 [Klebsiella variicola subsp. variicola]|nr:hypothetical protein [Klebsiella variicola subsp. variicola]
MRFSVDGIRRHPCGQQKAAESQHKAIGQPRQRSGRAAQRLLYRGGGHDAAGKT